MAAKNVCPNCDYAFVRHNGTKVTTVSGSRKDNNLNIKQRWTQEGYNCRKCGWVSKQ